MSVNFREQLKEILEFYSGGAVFDIEYPKKEFGHYSTNLAFSLAKKKKSNPIKIAGDIVSKLEADKKVMKNFEKISVAKPGFINFQLSPSVLSENLHQLLSNGGTLYGKNEIGGGKKLNLEFVSANPTGPLTVVAGRAAAYGDCLARILEYSDYNVTKEYYVNDIGRQIRILGESVARRYIQIKGETIEFPDEMYQGEYIVDIAKQFKKEKIYHGSDDDLEKLSSVASDHAVEKILEMIKKTLIDFGLTVDVWFSEKKLHTDGKIESVLNSLKGKDLVYETDGALWFRAKKFGLDQDIVMKKSIGNKATTYVLSDFAYAKDKASRKFDKNIYLFGADHHGDVPRIIAGIEALDLKSENFQFILHQMVNLKKGDQMTKMSKRKGEFVTLADLMKDISVDVIRYFFLAKSLNINIDFDLELAKEQSNKNPIFYIQYAHARVKSLVRKLEANKIKWDEKIPANKLDKLGEDEINLSIILSRFPEIIEDIVKDYQVHRLATYAYTLASAMHLYYEKNRVIDSETGDFSNEGELSFYLLFASADILSQSLSLMGISAPEEM